MSFGPLFCRPLVGDPGEVAAGYAAPAGAARANIRGGGAQRGAVTAGFHVGLRQNPEAGPRSRWLIAQASAVGCERRQRGRTVDLSAIERLGLG